MVQEILHDLITVWFEWLKDWGYWGVFFLMALESTFVPIPSEIIMPPAAYWASQGKMSFAGVVWAGTLGSYFGSAISYWFLRWVGPLFLEKYGKYLFIKPHQIAIASQWANTHGHFGIFMARFLPVVRHLISMPAGLLKMNFFWFSVATLLGAGGWCWVLAWFGQKTLGSNPALLDNPDEMVRVLKENFLWFVVAIAIFLALYIFVVSLKEKKRKATQ